MQRTFLVYAREKQLMTRFLLLSLIVSFAVLGASSESVLAQNRDPSASQRSERLTRCVRWSAFTRSLTKTSGGRGGIWLAFNELPDGFKQGCIFFQDNNAIDVAYVLKDGIEPSASLTNGQFYDYYGGVPGFGSGSSGVSQGRAEQSRQALQTLMRRSQALMITWLTPTNGSLPYLNSIPKGRAFVRNDGMVCFSTVCMTSSAVSNQELTRILEADQNLNAPRQSSVAVTPQAPEKALDELTDFIFYSLHPQLNRRRIRPDEAQYVKEWAAIKKVVSNDNLVYEKECGRNPDNNYRWRLSSYDSSGLGRNASPLSSPVLNKVADAVFYTRHPELDYRRIQPSETGLASEWSKIRQGVSSLHPCY